MSIDRDGGVGGMGRVPSGGAAEVSLLREVSLFMAGERTLTDAASGAGVDRAVVASLAAEFGAFMLPRASRALAALGATAGEGA